MDFLKGKIRPIYFRYLAAAFGSAMITSVYSVVDTAMVGQYHGPDGTAALAVVAPVWNLIYSLGLLMGIGGSVILDVYKRQPHRRSWPPPDACRFPSYQNAHRCIGRTACLCRSPEYGAYDPRCPGPGS